MPNRSNHHIVPHNWERASRKEWSSRISARFETQQEAIDYGRWQARGSKWELFIHWRNGKIRDRDSYGNDPFPPKG